MYSITDFDNGVSRPTDANNASTPTSIGTTWQTGNYTAATVKLVYSFFGFLKEAHARVSEACVNIQRYTHGVEVFNAGVLEALGDLASGDNGSHRVTIPHGLSCHRTPLDTTWFVEDGRKERETEVCVLTTFKTGVLWSKCLFCKRVWIILHFSMDETAVILLMLICLA